MGRLLCACLLLFAFSGQVSAHQPRLVMKEQLTEDHPQVIEAPEISKAYYGELKGSPDFYTFSLQKPLNFYVNVLVPDITNFNAIRFSVEISEISSNRTRVLLVLDGEKGNWVRYWERFGQDWYLKGPEARVQLTTNTIYMIRVYSRDNRGRYALATGEIESFPIDEIIKAIFNIPAMKKDFFGK